MNQTFRRLAGGLVLVLLLMQFNNCGNYADPASNQDSTSTLTCANNACVSSNIENLKVTPHLGNGEYAVPANLSEFNLGGDCNEAGYATNVVRWELVLNGVVVRHSGMLVSGQTVDSRCVNGRFLLYVELFPINEDNVDRTGLSSGGAGSARTAYELNVIIYGQDTPGGQSYQSPQGRTVVPLSAI